LEKKNEKKVFLPTENFTLKEYIDISFLFNKKEKVKEFFRFFLFNLYKIAIDLEKNKEGHLPLFMDKKTKNLLVDYGSLLYFLTKYLTKKYQADEKEAENYIYGYFSISARSSMNLPNAFLTKCLFSGIYKVVIYGNMNLNSAFNQTILVEGYDKNIYNFNAMFLNRKRLDGWFEKEEFYKNLVEYLSKKEIKILAKNNTERDMFVRKFNDTFSRLFPIFKMMM